MESLKECQCQKIPVMQQVFVINNIFWGLQKLDDGYNIYTDFPLKNKPMKGIRCCLYIDADPKYTMEFYHDDKGNHLGTVTENGHENFPFPDEEPFASCFADKMDMSKCRPQVLNTRYERRLPCRSGIHGTAAPNAAPAVGIAMFIVVMPNSARTPPLSGKLPLSIFRSKRTGTETTS